ITTEYNNQSNPAGGVSGFYTVGTQEPSGGGTPTLTITKTHTGTFTQNQIGATYTISVGNSSSATAPTSGTITVTENVPPGLTFVSMTGTGWNCSVGTTCTRSDALAVGGGYPAITVTMNVASNAPTSVTNQASVSGGGDTSGAHTANDLTTINSSGSGYS